MATINTCMNYDKAVERILQEAYFSGPHEKTSGIKRHVTFESGTEFGETSKRKETAMEFASDMAVDFLGEYDADAWQQENPDHNGGDPSKSEKIDGVIGLIGVAMNRFGMDGDEFTTADWNKYFKLISNKTHGKPPVSAERIRNVLNGAMKKIQAKIQTKDDGGEMKVKEPYEDPKGQAYQQAKDNLASFKSTRR